MATDFMDKIVEGPISEDAVVVPAVAAGAIEMWAPVILAAAGSGEDLPRVDNISGITNKVYGVVVGTPKASGKAAAAAGGTESYATDLYNTAVKGISTVRKAGFSVDSMLVNPDQEAVFMAMDKFISIEQLGRVGRLAEEGVIGNFYGTIPVYSTSVCGANPIVYSRAKGVAVGLRQDLQIEDYDDPIQGLEGAVLTMRYDLATAFSSAIRKLATS